MFKEINSNPNFPEQEKNIIQKWTEQNIVKKLRSQREESKAKEKIYYDGPITANGTPHYGHAITWTLKDVVPRFWSMHGYQVLRNMGWDCQGIPVEYEVEKELKFESKKDIENFGVEKFNQLCRESVMRYQKVMFENETRIGRWFDNDEIYSTMDPKYIESIWWSLKELYTKGLLYEGHKVVAYSTRAGSTLSTHEVSEGGYKEIEDPWITVKFKLKDATTLAKYLGSEKNSSNPTVYILAWTTTPWTMLGNLMLAVGEKIEYVLVEYEQNFYVLAKERLDSVFEGKEHKVVSQLKASELIGLDYEQPFNYYENKRSEGCFKIISAAHTNTEDGTGIVHLAPYGAEDFEVFQEKGIRIFDYLDESANFTSEIPEYQGLFYKQANKKIIEDLTNKGILFASGTILHRMPMCWRTNTPLIFKPVKSWYVAVTKIKEKLKKNNQELHWYPEHLKDGNSGIWINNARDWALSRTRYWGTPLPVWINDKTGERKFIGSIKELADLSGKTLTDPHKPFVDEVVWEDKENGGTFRRIKDVIDVWYDSGAMPFARWHYPFENKDKFESSYPAEYIAEGSDQVRLWFYVMHVLGTALFDKTPYRNALTNGTMLDEHGKKLSKSKKNYKPLNEVLDVYGGDVLRYFILNSPIVNGSDTLFSEKYLIEARKEFFLILWNSLKYFVSYANIHEFKPELGYPKLDEKNEFYLLDNWLLVKYKELFHSVNANMKEYKIMDAARLFNPFITDLSTWYIRRSRDRIKDGDTNALKTLFYVFSEMSKLFAPFLPFISEEIYTVLNLENLTGKSSVHLDTYGEVPELNESDKQLLQKMDVTRKIVSLALSIRVSQGIKIRQPLQSLYVEFKNGSQQDFIAELVNDELNVKESLSGTPQSLSSPASAEDNEIKVYLNTEITEDLKLEGDARDLIRKVQEKRKEMLLAVDQKVTLVLPKNDLNEKIFAKFENYLLSKTQSSTILLDDLVENIDIRS